MHVSKRMAVALLAASAFAGSATTAVTAVADPGHHPADHQKRGDRRDHQERGDRTVLSTSLAPSVPTDPTLLGAMAGNVPWVLRSGAARLRSDGRLVVRIRGLVIPTAPFTGTTGPVKTVSASLYCGGNNTPVGTSNSFPISTDGNARITANFTLPAKCQIPALLIHPNGANTAYIATSGFTG
jgi:hypothetical protein